MSFKSLKQQRIRSIKHSKPTFPSKTINHFFKLSPKIENEERRVLSYRSVLTFSQSERTSAGIANRRPCWGILLPMQRNLVRRPARKRNAATDPPTTALGRYWSVRRSISNNPSKKSWTYKVSNEGRLNKKDRRTDRFPDHRKGWNTGKRFEA